MNSDLLHVIPVSADPPPPILLLLVCFYPDTNFFCVLSCLDVFSADEFKVLKSALGPH